MALYGGLDEKGVCWSQCLQWGEEQDGTDWVLHGHTVSGKRLHCMCLISLFLFLYMNSCCQNVFSDGQKNNTWASHFFSVWIYGYCKLWLYFCHDKETLCVFSMRIELEFVLYCIILGIALYIYFPVLPDWFSYLSFFPWHSFLFLFSKNQGI